MKKRLSLALALSLSALTTLSAAPSVAALGVKNAASYSNPGFPNGSIAQGSLFVVFGTALGPAQIQYASSFPLPSNLAGTSASVTVSGTTVQCPMIYTSDGQIAAILPSNTPTGTGNIVIGYNGNSSPAPVKVVTSSPGIFTVNQQGSGPAVIQNGSGQQNALDFAFAPSQTVVIWGTGLGPISGSDASVPPSGNLPGVSVAVNVGGQNAAVVYAGRSQNAGVDQVNVTLPAGITGCYVPVYVTVTPTNGTPVTSNFGTLSIASSGTVCTDPTRPGLNLNGYKYGFVSLSRSTSSLSLAGQTINSVSDNGSGTFIQYDANYLSTASGFSFIDITSGSCSVIQFNGGTSTNPTLPKILDAGPVLNVSGPNGAKLMTKTSGFYSGSFGGGTMIPGLTSSPLYLDPGNYTIDNGSGGPDVGPFKLNLTVPPAFTWTNQAAIASVDRTQPLQITWTGGDPNSLVSVTGSSYADNSAFMSFYCYAKDSDLQLTVPAAILSLLPASTTLNTLGLGGTLTVGTNTTATGTAQGLDSLSGSVSLDYVKTGIAYK